MTVYNSTRGEQTGVQASYAILKGLADDGGLFVPETIPVLKHPLTHYLGMSYQELAYEVMQLYFTDFTEDELKACIQQAYDDKFDDQKIAPLVTYKGISYLELFHGATIAFKDMALSILPYLLKTSAKKQNVKDDIVILTATSGDTGKAALSGFADVPGTKIIVFYPKDGVSKVQEYQMITQKGDNTHVVGIAGNFDDAQTAVKAIFSDVAYKETLSKEGYQLSSANSINIGRLIPQVVYYVYGYLQMVAGGTIDMNQPINVSVPTGNFGNILAAYLAKNMGVPIDKLICASNDNKVLFDFIQTGTYDRRRDFILTVSPSMDILISSNLERLLYWLAGANADQTLKLMSDLKTQGFYTITKTMQAGLEAFYGNYSSVEDTLKTIKTVFDDTGYLLDPHTAVGHDVYQKYLTQTSDATKTMVVATASPYKFTKSVMVAFDEKYASVDDFDLVSKMEHLSGVPMPEAISEILNANIVHNTVCDKDDIQKVVTKWLLQ